MIARTPRGASAVYETRNDTSDGALVVGIVSEDEYGLGRLPRLSGWAIDIGAHIGTVAVALALDNPELSVVAVEALPENAEVLRQNVLANSLGGRVAVECAAAGSEREVGSTLPVTYGWSRSDNQPDGYMHSGRYIGGMVPPNETSTTIDCPVVSLGSLMDRYGISEVALLKIDCEGCEWFVLTSPAVSRIALILGEWHGGSHGTAEDLHRLLDATHEVTIEPDGSVGKFRAVRRD